MTLLRNKIANTRRLPNFQYCELIVSILELDRGEFCVALCYVCAIHSAKCVAVVH